MEKQRVNKRKDKKCKLNHAIKVVVRHLPPTMTEKEFLEQVDPLPQNDSFYYCGADWSLGQDATCRAYIDMSLNDMAEVLQFRDRFDGYVFIDSKGGEYVAIVEYAPFQCFSKNKARNNDNKVNTIEKESHFLEFLRKLTEEREESSRLNDPKIEFMFEHRNDEKVKSTPLLQYLANKKEKRREEARKRNEEKRKLREEMKLLQPIKPSECQKLKDANNEDRKPNASKNELKDGQGSEEIGKNSRSKRRTERDQRRREQHEQRKIAREREYRDKKKLESQERFDKINVALKSTIEPNQPNEQKSNKEIIILKKDTDVSGLPNCDAITSNDDYQVDIINLKDSNSTRQGNSASLHACKTATSRLTEEHRIRNKDRPSIAIYQPKVRKRLESEENVPHGCKHFSCTTESEVSLADDKPKNKRLGRRNKQKPQNIKDNIAET
ncbi:hypothetical protein KR222_008584 [Zaprionus bogoriensis]|nr:hypothetical protein KR222_008584 [Zaprionus bogoriensis]